MYFVGVIHHSCNCQILLFISIQHENSCSFVWQQISMLQDELAKLTLTELEKRDERQDLERVCHLFNRTIT